MSIPALIIQTARTRELPPLARASAANMKLLHPDWEYCFFDDDAVIQFMANECPEYRSAFDSFPYKIQRFDFFRYLAVYKLGGFYFDLDVLLWKSLSDLLDTECVFPFEELTLSRYLRERHGMDWEIGNYAFGASPGSVFLEAVIENCIRSQRDPDWLWPMITGIPSLFRADFEVLNSTGPGLLSRTLAENPSMAVDIKILFPEDVCDRNWWHRFGTYGVHLMEGSWRQNGNFLYRRLAWLWEARAKRKVMVQSMRLGPTRNAKRSHTLALSV
jgi:hypothetical protein